ncbi:RNA-dependent RNA polymerase [Lichuan virus]|uniref:RNA-directed RNA polymerase L n=1 Tax=Lichuan virus TaxID=2816943 RepID=A0A8A2MHU0_9VIRU|nr:RNA-dependent RNA polymerase [Lichuan virus]
MDQEIIRRFNGRIRAVREPTVARDILTDLYDERHNYFAREFCLANNLTYRNDVKATEIIGEMIPDFYIGDVEHIKYTPDNYVRVGDKIFIIDFKVSTDDTSSIETYNKYMNAFADIFKDVDYEVVIIRANPMSNQITIKSDEFRTYFGRVPPGLSFNWFFDLRRILMDKFKDNDEFQDMVDHGDFTLTAPWVNEETPELYEHPIYKEFIDSMGAKHEALFNKTLNHDAYESKADKWNSNLIHLKEKTEDYYNDFVKRMSDDVFLADGGYSKPTKNEIEQGWKEMTNRVNNEREVIQDLSKQKPSIHMIWAPNDPSSSNENNAKIIKLAKYLQGIKDTDKYAQNFQAIGKLMDFSENVIKYERFCNELKRDARAKIQKKDQRIEPIKIGDSTILWEQQFKYEIIDHDKYSRSDFYKNYLGIGGHKEFKDRSLGDINMEKPRVLDFNDPSIILASKVMMDKTKSILAQDNTLQKCGNLLDEYQSKIENASPKTWENIKIICGTRYWQAINDISTLTKNMLSVAQYNKFNTFRVVCCANNNMFGIVFPSSDIKTKKATMVFVTICIHDSLDEVLDSGALYRTYKSNGKYISISKGIRLDKERCQRLVSAPGLFMLTALLFKGDNDLVSMLDILNFSFFTSLSITKAMLSLTEPSRYMIMNSLAISSDVKNYMAEKFSPYTKTLFSVYMTNLIKKGCYEANEQKDSVELRDIFMSDIEITQKGVRSDRKLKSIWFPGVVNLKEYINQIYLPFYFNSKGLHEKHHVMIDLAKTVLEIEKDQRVNIPGIWGDSFEKQTVNLDVLIHSLAKNLMLDTSRHKHLRHRVEYRNNFKRAISTISTFTSSKSCIKVGDFEKIKTEQVEKKRKAQKKADSVLRVANPLLAGEIGTEEIHHADYIDLKKAVPEYIDVQSTKVFDRLYEKIKDQEIENITIEEIMKVMRNHKQFYFAYFNKGQKTAKDREIFVGEFEAKMCLYGVERISKERCKLNPEEMISEPGDGKLKRLEQMAEDEIRFIIENVKSIKEKDGKLTAESEFLDRVSGENARAQKIEINADMSKWSAQDVMYKYFWLFAMDPILYPFEKKRILYFLCNYMQKRLILPDELMYNILDQRFVRSDDIIMEMTNGFRRNWVEIKRNWLQGNLNYTSSYLHSCAMSVYRDIFDVTAKRLQGEVLVNSLVHSDDNQTSISMIQSRLDTDKIIQFAINTFAKVCLAFGNQPNMKKTYITNFIKEFVSLFNIYGEPFSVFGRFILTCVGDCAYIGPYEDFASRLSATQTAIKHGCPPSIAWVSIALNQWITYSTYNMLPGQNNDPAKNLGMVDRFEIPIELGGYLESELSTIALLGLEAANVTFLTKLMQKMSNIMYRKEDIVSQTLRIDSWNLEQLTKSELFKLKLLRYVSLDSEMSIDSGLGETSDMRSRSLITPRKFTTIGSLSKLASYRDYQRIADSVEETEELFEYFIANPELLVTKGETTEEFCKTVLYRYNSKKFKESLSIQNPVQLFIEQILFSNKPTIDYTGLSERFANAIDFDENLEETTISGRMTIAEALRRISEDINRLEINHEEIKTVYGFCISNDPMIITASNSIILQITGTGQERTGMSSNYMPEMRNFKLMQHSPAVVLRGYIHGVDSVEFADQSELKRDIIHLEDFINKTKLKERMEERIRAYHETNDDESKRFDLKEITKFYQVCYDYIKSTEHKVKVFILPIKVHTASDFCAVLHGNLLMDNQWFNIHYLRQIESSSHKGEITSFRNVEIDVAVECFKLLAHFADWFIAGHSRKVYLKLMIQDYSYKGMAVKELYEILKRSEQRVNFIPILFRLGDLKQEDINKFDALKTNEKITWNNWQVSQRMNTGLIDLTITGYNKKITITGEDDRLDEAILYIKKDSYDQISNQSRKLLNTRHNLMFEKMKPVKFIDPREWYICHQKGRRGKCDYVVLLGKQINARNEQISQIHHRSQNYLVPVCPVGISIFEDSEVTTLDDIENMNLVNDSVTRIQINRDEFAMVRRAMITKMIHFTGPPMVAGIIDIEKLMHCRPLLNITYTTVKNSSLMDIVQIFSCKGDDDSKDGTFAFSEDPLEDEESQEIDSLPIFNVTFRKRGKSYMSYKNAIEEAIRVTTDEFKAAFDFSEDGFFSSKNLGIIQTISCLIKELGTNEWSTSLDKCIHLCMYREGMDENYHLFEMPKYFLRKIDESKPDETIVNKGDWGDVVEQAEYEIINRINWEKILGFIDALPNAKGAPWSEIFSHFKRKARELVLNKISLSQKKMTLEDFAEELKVEGGKSMYQFF